jgi:hypothetical protein
MKAAGLFEPNVTRIQTFEVSGRKPALSTKAEGGKRCI